MCNLFKIFQSVAADAGRRRQHTVLFVVCCDRVLAQVTTTVQARQVLITKRYSFHQVALKVSVPLSFVGLVVLFLFLIFDHNNNKLKTGKLQN